METKTKQAITNFIHDQFMVTLSKKMTKGFKLKNFKINPFSMIMIANGILGEMTKENIAKALIYPRVFGTSINTKFGNKIQKLCVDHLGAEPSAAAGMDIEFFDQVDRKKTLVQLKAGPNTINSDDVDPMLKKMEAAYRILRTNSGGANMPTFAVGVAYGIPEQISGHYKKIAGSNVVSQVGVPIYVGEAFWYRLTGDQDFYEQLVLMFMDCFKSESYAAALNASIEVLADEVEERYFTAGSFDPNKI